MDPARIELPGADGLKLNAFEWSREGTPLVFVHGFGNDSHVWDEIAPKVAPHYRTLAIDLRGHGDSDPDPEGRYDHTSMARDLETAADSLGIGRAVLVGHSLGGRVSMAFAGRNPDKMAGLVIVDSAPSLDRRGTARIRQETESLEPSFASVRDYERVLLHQYPAARPETLARLARLWLRQRDDGRYETKTDLTGRRRRVQGDPEEVRRRMEDETQRLWDALESARCPVLVIRGAASDVLDADTADRMVDEVLANGKLAVVPRASHSVMLDNPEGFAQALCDFILG